MTTNAIFSATSSTTAAGPVYYVVASDAAVRDSGPSYFQGILMSQVQQLKAHFRESLATSFQKGELAAPAQQLTEVVSQNIDRFVSRLDPYVFLYDGWNGEDSRAPSAIGIWQAVVDSFKLIAIGLPAPQPKLLQDGTLGIYWRRGSNYAAIDFEEDGVHVWTVTNGETFTSGTWDTSQAIPTNLATLSPATQEAEIGVPMPLR